MKNELYRIANILLMYGPQISRNGLCDGKIGLILFFYHYSRFTNSKFYNDYADSMLEKVIGQISQLRNYSDSTVIDVGLVISYLVENKFVEGDLNDILYELDHIVLENKFIVCDRLMWNQGIYIVKRLQENAYCKNELLEKTISLLNSELNNIIKTDALVSLGFINSILFFLIFFEKKLTIDVKIIKMKINTFKLLKKTIKLNNYDNVDLRTCLNLINGIEDKSYDWIYPFLIKHKIITNDSFSVKDFNKEVLMNMLYFGNKRVDVPCIKKIKEFIYKIQMDVTEECFFFQDGLIGLGYGLLTQNLNNTNKKDYDTSNYSPDIR